MHNAQLDAFKCRSFIALLMNYQLTVRARFWSRVAPSIAAETVEDAPRNMGEDELIHFRCYYYCIDAGTQHDYASHDGTSAVQAPRAGQSTRHSSGIPQAVRVPAVTFRSSPFLVTGSE